MVEEGIVSVQDLPVVCHRMRKVLLPRNLLVRDAMTRNPKSVGADMAANEVARLLLSAAFHAMPVVDAANRPVGLITQGDLIERAGMPVRLGLLEELGHPGISTALNALSARCAGEIMSHPATTIQEDQPLTEAVKTMLAKGFKRLPVVDAAGKLAGVLSRYDIFHTISRETPDWAAIKKRDVTVHDFRTVADVMQREAHTVLPDATVDEVLHGMGAHDVQRVAVVDKDGKFLGLIADRDLLRAFSEHKAGLWEYVASVLGGKRSSAGGERLREVAAATIMKKDAVTVHDNTPLDEAIKTMTILKIKRLPVVDADGRFKGMISRDALLRAGVEHA
jgi:CBS domain-containing protein